MTNERNAGRLIFCGLPGPELTTDIERRVSDLAPSGVILFARNLKSPAQVRDLVAGIRETLPHPALVALDQEGGTVNRLRELSPVFRRLPLARVQATWGEDLVEEVWTAVGRCLAAAGFDVSFAPVVDLDDGDGANAIGPRSFGLDPGKVAAHAARVLAGLSRAGVAGCAKHFPGLGGTDLDTHKALATSPLDAKTLRAVHVRPYEALAGAAPFVMTAHAHYPSVDGPEPLPATFSRRLLTGWLREEIGYEGLVISDDLEMGALATFGTPGERAVRTLSAGADIALFCHHLDAPRIARDAIVRALETGSIDAGTVTRSLTRLASLLARFPGARAPSSPAPFDDCVEALSDLLASET